MWPEPSDPGPAWEQDSMKGSEKNDAHILNSKKLKQIKQDNIF